MSNIYVHENDRVEVIERCETMKQNDFTHNLWEFHAKIFKIFKFIKAGL